MLFGLIHDNDKADDSILFRRFHRALAVRAAQDTTWLLVVDEAQNLSIEQLEQLRLLSNSNSAGNIALQVILARRGNAQCGGRSRHIKTRPRNTAETQLY